MTIAQPGATDLLNAPSHSKLHRVLGIDPSAPDQSATIDSGGVFKAKTVRSVVANGDFGGGYAASQYKILIPMDLMTAFPNGITIKSWYLRSDENDPAIEMDGNLRYCDSPGNGAFPGANIVLIDSINSTQGNSSHTGMSTSVPAGKCIYLQFDASPGTGKIWTFTLNFEAAQ